MFQTIDEKKSILDKKRPLPEYTLRSLREKLLLEWTYHSNAIEGNTLTLQETKVVLEGITVGGKTMREHLEAINHYDIHLKAGDEVEVPQIDGYHPFLYVMDGSIQIGDQTVKRREAVTDSEGKLPFIQVEEDASLVLFLSDLDAEMSMAGTISGRKE